MFKVARFVHSVNLKMYDICHISAACRVEYEIKNEQVEVFSLCKTTKCTISHISAACRIEYELKNDQS